MAGGAGIWPKNDGDDIEENDANESYFNGTLESSVLNYGVVTVGTGSGVALAANTSRRSILFRNNSTGTMYFGDEGVTTGSGKEVKSGENLYILEDKSAIYVVGSDASLDMRYLEVSR